MPREYVIYGEVMVWAGGSFFDEGLGGAELNSTGGRIVELGLASDSIKITPRFVHKGIHTDDFGGVIPVDVQWMMADCLVEMTLIHYDVDVLDTCIRQTMGGVDNGISPGLCGAAGTPLGAGGAVGSSRTNLVFVYLQPTPTNEQAHWRFPSCFLMDKMEYPIGTEKSLVKLTWCAIPHVELGRTGSARGRLRSKDAVVWDHVTMTHLTPLLGRDGPQFIADPIIEGGPDDFP